MQRELPQSPFRLRFVRQDEVLRAEVAGESSLENTIVVGKRTVLNDSLRFAYEFVRHKVLDLIGDLLLLERPILGHVVARNGGHSLNHDLVAAIRKAAEPHWGRRRSKVAVDSMVGVEALPGVAAL